MNGSSTYALWIAIYGAALSTFVAGWKIYGIVRDRARVKVEVFWGQIGYAGDQDVPSSLIVKAVNTGRRPVSLDSAGLSLSNGTDMISIGAPESRLQLLWGIPKRLEEGESAQIWFNEDALKQKAKEGVFPMKAWFKDTKGRMYRAKISKHIIQFLRIEK